MKLALTLFVLSALLQIAACTSPHRMSNADIIRETKACRDAGLNAESLRSEFGTVTGVQCAPKESP